MRHRPLDDRPTSTTVPYQHPLFSNTSLTEGTEGTNVHTRLSPHQAIATPLLVRMLVQHAQTTRLTPVPPPVAEQWRGAELSRLGLVGLHLHQPDVEVGTAGVAFVGTGDHQAVVYCAVAGRDT